MDRLLIDGNSVGHASHQGRLLRTGGMETQAVFGIIRFARKIKIEHDAAQPLFLWDGLSWRKEAMPDYKANREANASLREERRKYKAQRPYIARALTCLGMPQVIARNLEADDLAYHFSQRFIAQGDHVIMITGDRDWLQLIHPQCEWRDHRDESRMVVHSTFERHTGYKTPFQFVQSKALQGDISDNLKGVGKIGEKGAAELIGVWGDVRAFLADPNPAVTYKGVRGKNLPKAFRDFATMPERQENYFRNMRLMYLSEETLPKPIGLKLQHKPVDPQGFKSLCQELGFASIYTGNQFDTFMAPFL